MERQVMPNRLTRAMLRPDAPPAEACSRPHQSPEPAPEDDVLGDCAGAYAGPDQTDGGAEDSAGGAAHRHGIGQRPHCFGLTLPIASSSLPTIVLPSASPLNLLPNVTIAASTP